MTAKTAIQWVRKEDERWAAAFELHLVTTCHPPRGLAHQALSEIHEMVTEAGRPAEELFGDPRQYAASVAADRIDETHTSRVDLAGATPGERFTDAVVIAGFMGLTLSTVRWARDGLWLDVSSASLAGVGVVTAAALVFCLALALRTAGRVRAMRACLAISIVGAVGGAAAASAASEHVLFSLPALVPLAASVVVMVGAYRLPHATADRWFTPARGGGSEQWMQQLDGLLRGRHGMQVKDAREHVAEVRSHLAGKAGLTAQGEFGDVEAYAAGLAGGPRRAWRAQRRKAYSAGAFALAIAVANVDALRGLDVASFWFWFGLLAVVFSVANAAWLYGDFRRRRR
ncbi:hypothetical protein QZH56_12370 [Streptomyces olivoreticuli]|uniref:hypothetical protein n=1 Tax=Streptomyces olivoreticuli TaxID=68246 RepID=UPI0026584039|nr:hypothetical protein [Streptomyces olivoreticuli]WKK26315.1 hypothetical protein QZH56_12370 [Streptomyces olivoreticuli]